MHYCQCAEVCFIYIAYRIKRAFSYNNAHIAIIPPAQHLVDVSISKHYVSDRYTHCSVRYFIYIGPCFTQQASASMHLQLYANM